MMALEFRDHRVFTGAFVEALLDVRVPRNNSALGNILLQAIFVM
jgi:hypothetical protein